jgi:beta-glucanase (GH16 family)
VAGTPSGAADLCTLRPVLIEDFNDLSVDANKIGPARWTSHTPWAGDFGEAVFLDPGPDGPFKVDNGILSITAKRDANGRWTSGLLAAADRTGAGSGTRYGYFEARMKLPPGPGLWPAFWLTTLKPIEPTDPNGSVELDVIEYYGRFPGAYNIATHGWYKEAGKTWGKIHTENVESGSLVNDFHTYGVDISPLAINFFLDRRIVWTQPTPKELTRPMYPLINLALGGGWPIDGAPDPSVLLVDYVHVFGRGAGPPEGCTPGPLL